MDIVTNDIMEPKEVAQMLKVSERTVIRLVERGELIGFKVGDRWRFNRSDIDSYINAQKQRQRD